VRVEVLRGQLLHLAVGNLDAARVGAGVAFGVDGQAGAGRGAGDEVDGGFVAGQRLSG
jgi:hypothetical protein